jgi:membrane protease YdiL (CAAX protease family)
VRDLPPPLPPETRTIGQLVAETIRAYGNTFWRVLPLGVPLAVADQLSVRQTATVQMAVFWALLPLFVGAYLWACRVVLGAAPTVTAGAVAVLVWLPFPALRYVYVLPALAWLAFIGLSVPAAMAERLRFREALVRGRRLGTADFVHAVGSLATLVIVVGIAANTLSALLHTQGDNGQRVAVFLSDLVLSPLLFLGGALLYVDQAARAVRSAPDAALHPPVDADAAGRPDPQVES